MPPHSHTLEEEGAHIISHKLVQVRDSVDDLYVCSVEPSEAREAVR